MDEARRSEPDLFVAVLNGENARHVDIPMDFLGVGAYTAQTASDVVDHLAAVTVETSRLGLSDILPINLRPGGGIVARFSRTSDE